MDPQERDQAADRRWLFHLAIASEWEEAIAKDVYERSTLNNSLADQGFIHCSFAEQVQSIADFIYAGRSDVLLLRIDPARLATEVRVEDLDGGGAAFPHIYGPLPLSAVVRVDEVPVDADGRLDVGSLV